ncbi:cache domain-containing sensor histidine kinase [Cohnella fermenti]|uniref:Sensor histidine kinase n=1 Tax=Cohnella fermenti TaxID=2565925 RepID=A0A4S4BLG4_9BACL|nr:sensor histidine kinase [Cohnella fermenti]THF75011.1 sensor histidine kinase [Cohnella fermenti]
MKALTIWTALRRYVQRSIYRKILLSFFFIIFLTITVLVANFYSRTAGDLRRQSIETTERLTQQSADTLGLYLNNVRNFAWSYFGDKDFQGFVLGLGSDPVAYSDYTGKFNQFAQDNPIVTEIVVSQLDGFSLRAGSSTAITSQEERERLEGLASEENGKGAWQSSQTYDRQSGTMVNTLTFVQAVRNISSYSPGPIIGVMTYELSYSFLQQWLGEAAGGGTSQFYIIDWENGNVVYSEQQAMINQPMLDDSEIADVHGSATAGYFYSRARIGGEASEGLALVAYKKLPGTSWMLVSWSSVQSLQQPVNDFTKRTLILGCLCFLVAIALAGVIARRIVIPLKELNRGLKAIEYGNYGVNLPIRSQDEVGYLSTSFNRMAAEINRLILKVYETEMVKKDMEIKSLQSQINPHFLYNTLGIIDSLATMDGNRRISAISQSLARMFRYNISGGDQATLAEEMEQIRLYLYIQQVRFEARLDHTVYVEPGIESIRIPKLLIQPLVENCIQHGIRPSLSGGTVRVEATMNEAGGIQIQVWNNGCPIDPERQEWLSGLLQAGYKSGLEAGASGEGASGLPRESIGLRNVQSRVRMVYGTGAGLAFESNPATGTTFTLTLGTVSDGEEAEHENDRA